MVRVTFVDAHKSSEAGTYAAVRVGEHEITGVADNRLVVIATRDDDGWWVPCGESAAYPSVGVVAVEG